MAGPAHRSVSNIRPSITSLHSVQGASGSPHTPSRTLSATYGSPSALRVEDDCVIIQLGTRYLRAGFAGDALPKAVIGFGPEEYRRAGDFRQWKSGHAAEWRQRRRGNNWGETHELWSLDLRNTDLSWASDKIERTLREAFTKYLLIDSRPRRTILVVPTAMPLPLLSIILDTLFHTFQPPTISILSEPMLTTVGAGLRSGLVVDIGWAETVVTSIYEYREVSCRRSVRASRLLSLEVLRMIFKALDPTTPQQEEGKAQLDAETKHERCLYDTVSFEECEEVMERMVWCRPVETFADAAATGGLPSVREEDEAEAGLQRMKISDDMDGLVNIPLASTKPPTTLKLPFSLLSEPCEVAYFADGNDCIKWDDEELPLHHVIYRALLHLPVDVRSICMSRIIFTGGGSKVPGLKHRALEELRVLVQQRGWDPVQGKAVEQLNNNVKLRTNRSKKAKDGPKEVTQENTNEPISRFDANGRRTAAFEDQTADPIENQIRREASKAGMQTVQGILRAVNSMGPWSGASLVTQLKIPAVSIVDKEQWLQHGAAGASRNIDVMAANSRQSMGPGGLRGGGDRTSWTLGPWGP